MTVRINWRAAVLGLIGLAAVGRAAPPEGSPTGRFSAIAFGAVGDGKTDATAALQKALDAAGQAGGGVVELPAGRFRVDGTLSVPRGVTLQGTYRAAPTIAHKEEKPSGTVLLAYAGRGKAEGTPFLRLAGANAAVAGLAVIYPEWKQTDVPPVPYPPCVESKDTDNVAVLDCCFLNAYEAIHLVRAGRHLVRNVTGYPSRRGLSVDECYDIGRIENVHFWPFGLAYQADDPYCQWINTEGVAFELARTDWHYVLNTFCFGYGVGYKFSESKHGSANGNFLGLGADSCRRSVLVEQAQAPGLLFTNGEFVGRWGSKDSVGVEVGEKARGKVSLVNCSFWGPLDRCVWMRGAAGQFTAQACHFVEWDNTDVGSPALQVDAGRAIVSSCTFEKEGTHVRIGTAVRSALVSVNQAAGGLRIDNQAGSKLRALGNEVDPLDETPSARAHYRVTVGVEGDGRFLQGWHGRERMGRGPFAKRMRWSRETSLLTLPVVPGQASTLRLEMSVPPQAVSPEAGIYLGGKKLAGLPSGPASEAGVVDVPLPAGTEDRVTLEVRCRGWSPRATGANNRDNRTLGVMLHGLTVRAASANGPAFDANPTGP